MAKWKKIAIGTGAVLGVGILAFLGGAFARYDRTWDRPLPDLHASTDPEVIERGRYFVWGPGHCAGCHGAIERYAEYEQYATEIPLTGGFAFDLPPGKIVAPNITPDPSTGIGEMSDEQIARALRHGVGRDDRMLFPIMPFQHVADDDLVAIISYLRTLEPIRQDRPRTELSLLGKVLFAYVIEPAGPTQDVPVHVEPGPTAAYGEYLVKSVANCYGCHTNRDLKTGDFIGEPMAGGLELDHQGTKFRIPNITPAGKGSRISQWDQAGFIARVRTGQPSAPGSPMPWAPLSKLSDGDLIAIWAYMQTVPSIDNDTGPSIVAE